MCSNFNKRSRKIYLKHLVDIRKTNYSFHVLMQYCFSFRIKLKWHYLHKRIPSGISDNRYVTSFTDSKQVCKIRLKTDKVKRYTKDFRLYFFILRPYRMFMTYNFYVGKEIDRQHKRVFPHNDQLHR